MPLEDHHTVSKPKYPHVSVRLVGADSNIFSLLGLCTRAMREAGVSLAEQNDLRVEVTEQPSYHAALNVLQRTVKVS